MHLSYEIDKDAAGRAALGLIVLQADETIEADFRRCGYRQARPRQ